MAILQGEKPEYFNLKIIQGYKKYNVSSTKARIYMKFETYSHQTVIDQQQKFHDARTGVINSRAHVHMFTTRACESS